MTSTVYVYTLAQIGQVGAWSRYLFPFTVDGFAIDGNTLLVRSGDRILEVSEDYPRDLVDSADEADIEAVIWTPFLEMGGQLGQDKTMEGFDLVGTADELHPPMVEFGWNQNNPEQMTPPVTIPADTLPDSIIPMELTAPSISVRITYTGGRWQFDAVNVYLEGRRLAR